jgi:hypothetical protein
VKRSADPHNGKIPDQKQRPSPATREDPERILFVLEEKDLPRRVARISEDRLLSVLLPCFLRWSPTMASMIAR